MDAIKYLVEKNRMTKNCGISCTDCPLAISNNGTDSTCCTFEYRSPEKCISIVEEWSKNHPIKTRQSELLKMFPNVVLDDRGVVKLSPCDFGYTCEYTCDSVKDCHECRKHFWLEEIKEEE